MMDQFLTILAIVVGWGLNEFSQLYRSSQDHKRAISKALSILLDVRFHTEYIEKILPELKKKGIPDEAIPFIRNMYGNIGVDFTQLSEKYDSAMEIVAESAPLIAYEYRSKAHYPNFVKEFRSLATENGVEPEVLETIESALNTVTLPRMNELVTELAALHSKKTYKQVKSIVEKEFEVPKALTQYFENIEKANKSSQSDAQKACASA